MKGILVALIIAMAGVLPGSQTQNFTLEEIQIENIDGVYDVCKKEYNGILPFLRNVNKVDEVWIFNTNTEQVSRLETNNKPKYRIGFNGRFIVWSQKDMPNGQPQPSFRGDLAYYDLETRTCNEFARYPGMAKEFYFDGNYVVWSDIITVGTFDFRFYNLMNSENGVILHCENNKNRGIWKKIIDEKVYYIDNRDSERKLYCFGFASKTESLVFDRTIETHYFEKLGNFFIWIEYNRESATTTLCKYNLANGTFEYETYNGFIRYITKTEENKLAFVLPVGDDCYMTELVYENGSLSSNAPFKCSQSYMHNFYKNSSYYFSYNLYDYDDPDKQPKLYAIHKDSKSEISVPFNYWITYIMHLSDEYMFLLSIKDSSFVKVYKIK